MTSKRHARSGSLWLFPVLLAIAGLTEGCVKGNPASDTADPGFPFGPATIGVRSLSYDQDIKAILNADCLSCHSSRESRGNYSVSSYADVMQGQQPGDARGSLVVDCSPGGSMYGYFSGDRVTKATEVFRWLAYYNAPNTR